ncbi:hypothetical protein Pst134EB_028262 [Puccinia striiformis f. sp. tritici]|nr:hypothetical protein Pst134EB_028262 [Puccinia striiformis f. sp. tritici]
MGGNDRTTNERTSLLRHPLPQILKHHSHQEQQPLVQPPLISTANYHLTNAYHLAGLVNDQGGEYEKYRKSSDELKQLSSKARQFYERQNSILDYFLEIDSVLDSTRRRNSSSAGVTPERRRSEALIQPDHDHDHDDLESDTRSDIRSGGVPVESAHKLDRERKESLSVRRTISINFFINFVLLAGKIVVALLSNSISLIASLVDSAMDFLSTAIIWWTNRKIDSKSWQSIWQYPAGKRRMEPMGVVVFSVFMISSFVQVLVESIERLLSGTKSAIRKKNTSVKALAQDAENDCILNIFSLLFPYIGLKFNLPWLDAVGGLILSLYIITEWTGTLFDNVKNLTGRRADPIQHQRVAYLVTRFSPLIQAVQHCHVYQAGDDLIVETDVILSPETPLVSIFIQVQIQVI